MLCSPEKVSNHLECHSPPIFLRVGVSPLLLSLYSTEHGVPKAMTNCPGRVSCHQLSPLFNLCSRHRGLQWENHLTLEVCTGGESWGANGKNDPKGKE